MNFLSLKFIIYRGNCGKPEQRGNNPFEGITRTRVACSQKVQGIFTLRDAEGVPLFAEEWATILVENDEEPHLTKPSEHLFYSVIILCCLSK